MITRSHSSTNQSISEPHHALAGSEIFFDTNQPTAPKVVLVASVAWVLWNYRLALIHALEKAGYEVVLVAADDGARPELERRTGAPFLPLKHLRRNSLSPFTNLRLLLELFVAFRRLRPDIVLLFTIRPNTFGNFAAQLLGIPTISVVEGIGISGSLRSRFRHIALLLYRLAFRSAGRVIFLNQEDREEFAQKRIVEPHKSIMIPGPGIDLDHFTPREKDNASSAIVFLFVGRLLSEKGIREFAEAARILKRDGENAECRVLGAIDPGNPMSINSSELDTWVAEGILYADGFLNDVRPAIANADVVVLPSYYREGVPRSLLEGMAMGKMILTTNQIGCRDTIEHGKNGYLIPHGNAIALAEAMKKVVRLSNQQIQEMGAYGRLKVERQFADPLVVPRYLAVIQALLGQVPAGIDPR